jgi:HemY protein
VADGVVSERWAPVSPVTGRLDAFEWRAPAERLGQLIDSGEDEPGIGSPALVAPVSAAASSGAVHSAPSPKAADNDRQGTAEDIIAPVTAAEQAAVAVDSETVEPSAEPMRLPDDPGIDPDDAEQDVKSANRFRLF